MLVGDLFHVVHVVGDLSSAEVWYERVFSPVYMFRRHESPLDHRTASMMLVADFPAEPMEPHTGKAGEEGTIGKFRRRFGPRLHSLAFYCDSVGEGYERFRSLGVRVSGDGGAMLTEAPSRGGIYTHPRDTFGLIELIEPRIAGRGGAPVGDSLGDCYDPRLLGTHDPTRWEREHPLGIRRTSHVTVLVDDLDRAVELYVGGLDAVPFHDEGSPRRVYVLVGSSTVVELAEPRPDSEESASLATDGAMIWSATFEVADLSAAGEFLDSVGVGSRLRDDLLEISTADAHGGRYVLAAHGIEGDPRP